jgi:hypothetical protein
MGTAPAPMPALSQSQRPESSSERESQTETLTEDDLEMLEEELLMEYTEPEDEVEFITLAKVFDEHASEDEPNSLPKHMRCAAHTLNLVATKDAEKALVDDSCFKTVWRKAMGKAQSLWNAQNRSTQAADKIKEHLKRRLKTPNSTRWNSTYDAISVLNTFLEESRQVLMSFLQLS